MLFLSDDLKNAMLETINNHPKISKAYKREGTYYIEFVKDNTLYIRHDDNFDKLQKAVKKELGILLWSPKH